MEKLLLPYIVSLSTTLIIISGKLFFLSICAPLEIISVAAIRRKTVYRIAGNFRGVNIRYFRGQADLHEVLT